MTHKIAIKILKKELQDNSIIITTYNNEIARLNHAIKQCNKESIDITNRLNNELPYSCSFKGKC